MDYSSCPTIHPLTRTERNCLELLAIGQDDTKIGQQLILTQREVETIISVATIKLGVKTRMAAVARAMRLGILEIEK